MLNNVLLLGADTSRTRAYLDLLHRVQLDPVAFIHIDSETKPGYSNEHTTLFDYHTPSKISADQKNINVISLKTTDINAASVVHALNQQNASLVIFSGPSGSLIHTPLFSTRKTFIHVHPGKLPEYKGSTTIYYSLLAQQPIVVTALILNERIDSGPIIDWMICAPPEDKAQIDRVFDPYIRAVLLTHVLKNYQKNGILPHKSQPESLEQPYYVIHPVLKHIAILSRT